MRHRQGAAGGSEDTTPAGAGDDAAPTRGDDDAALAEGDAALHNGWLAGW